MNRYTGLNQLLENKGVVATRVAEKLNISSRTLAKISKGQKVSNKVLQKYANYFDVPLDSIVNESVETNLLERLQQEQQSRVSGGVYHELQIRMTYNSNHMEGSTLTSEQTRHIFETQTIVASDGVLVDDIIETRNHFKAIDYCIMHAKQRLDSTFIKKIHRILKTNTQDECKEWFAIGDYKKRPNMVGGMETTAPEKVSQEMEQLLHHYRTVKKKTFADIIDFHVAFERIHPFQDGNGRVGRLIAFKECLKHEVVPFIIEDRKKHFYYRGLQNYDVDKQWLIETCLDGQDSVKQLLDKLDVYYY